MSIISSLTQRNPHARAEPVAGAEIRYLTDGSHLFRQINAASPNRAVGV
jgi:hypothetical protein